MLSVLRARIAAVTFKLALGGVFPEELSRTPVIVSVIALFAAASREVLMLMEIVAMGAARVMRMATGAMVF